MMLAQYRDNPPKGNDMPKNKTHSGMKKRVKVTGTGKLLTERAGKRHLLERKSSTAHPPTQRHRGDRRGRHPRVKRMLGR